MNAVCLTSSVQYLFIVQTSGVFQFHSVLGGVSLFLYWWRLAWSISREIYAMLLLYILNLFSKTLKKLAALCLKTGKLSVLMLQQKRASVRIEISASALRKCDRCPLFACRKRLRDSWTAALQETPRLRFCSRCLGTSHSVTISLKIHKTCCCQCLSSISYYLQTSLYFTTKLHVNTQQRGWVQTQA